MLDRQACERRVYRLAVLLTGNPVAATAVIARVVDSQPDLRQLDSSHLDRLTVLRSREIPPARLVSDLVPDRLAAALESLAPQQREAWVFSRVYRSPDREMSKAMDCSVSATKRHLDQADAAIRERLGAESQQLARQLLAYSMSLDVPRFYRIERNRRRYARLTLMAIGVLAAVMLLAALMTWWARPLDGR